VITLSPSAIQDYVLCPRKFYYGRVLRVHTEQNQAASIGILIHRLMEVFNQLYGQTPEQYTPEHLMRLKTELFDTMPLSQDSHFTENDRNRLESLEPLARSDLEKRVTAALEDMIAKGYFSRPVRRVFPEVRLSGWKLPGCSHRANRRQLGRTGLQVLQ
jgi:ATP-dependent helicase/DNAse subunit B